MEAQPVLPDTLYLAALLAFNVGLTYEYGLLPGRGSEDAHGFHPLVGAGLSLLYAGTLVGFQCVVLIPVFLLTHDDLLPIVAAVLATVVVFGWAERNYGKTRG